jgi:hypothetical protein
VVGGLWCWRWRGLKKAGELRLGGRSRWGHELQAHHPELMLGSNCHHPHWSSCHTCLPINQPPALLSCHQWPPVPTGRPMYMTLVPSNEPALGRSLWVLQSMAAGKNGIGGRHVGDNDNYAVYSLSVRVTSDAWGREQVRRVKPTAHHRQPCRKSAGRDVMTGLLNLYLVSI